MHVVLDDARHYLETRKLSGKHATVLSPAASVVDLTNGHLTEHGVKSKAPSHETQTRLLVWSASDEVSLKNLLAEYQRHLSNLCNPAEGTQYFEDLCYTLSCRRSLLPWKTFLVCNSLHELRGAFSVKYLGLLRSRNAPIVSFVFTGQGAQWSGMGRELLGHHVFRTSLEQASHFLKGLGCAWSLVGTFLIISVLTHITDMTQRNFFGTNMRPTSIKRASLNQFVLRCKLRWWTFMLAGALFRRQ